MSQHKSNPLMIIVSSPSGAGKTSVCKKILEDDKNLRISISDTTRQPRDNEVEGKDYNFISINEFKQNIKNDLYIEYAKVFNNYYGSQRKNILNYFNEGKDVLFDIDWQGAQQLKNSNLSYILSIFIIPPSKDSIYDRLKSRSISSGDNESNIKNRMKMYEIEMSHKEEYDFVVLNDNFNDCIDEIKSIINSTRNSH